MKKRFRGDVGIGTLIVFIAMVLVAAVAATVLLNVSGMLQQKASSTGKQATQQVSSNIMVLSVTGYQSSVSAKNIIELLVSIKAASGSGQIDLKNMQVRVTNGTSEQRLVAQPSGASATQATNVYFGLVERIDPDNLFSADANTANYVINQNSLIDLNISLRDSPNGVGMNLTPRTPFEIELIPETGAPVKVTFVAPATFPTSTISLYP